MNWDAASAIAEILSAIGVLVSLVYLAIQIRSNTKGIWSQVIHSQTEQSTRILEMQLDPTVREALMAAYRDDTVTREQYLALEAYMIGAIAGFSDDFMHFKAGFMDGATFASRRRYIAYFLSFDWGRRFWKHAKAFQHAELVAEIDRILDEEPFSLAAMQGLFSDQDAGGT